MIHSQTIAGGPSKVNDAVQAACAAPTTNAELASDCLPDGLEVADPASHLADDVVRLPMLDQARPCRIGETHDPDALVRVERIGADAQLGLDVVLEQSMDHDDVAADQFLATGHPLPGDQAVMDDELQVEPGDVGAGVAVALRRLADVAETPAEGDVAVLDGVLEDRSVDRRR